MAIIVKADIEVTEKYSKGSAYAVNGKQRVPAYFRLLVDDFTLDDAVDAYKYDNNIVALDYVGNLGVLQEYSRANLQGVYMVREFEFGDNITEEDIVDMINRVPAEVTVLVRLSDTFSDMKFVQEMCRKYRNVRFCGGLLFALEDCRLGCCDKEILTGRGVRVKSDDFIKTGNGCALDYAPLASIELEFKEKPVKTKTTKVKVTSNTLKKTAEKATKTPKEPSASKEQREKVPKKPTVKQAMGSLLFSRGLSDL